MNFSLTPELEQFVAEKVRSGRYASASEVVREALRLLEQQDEEHEQWLQYVLEKIDRGLAQAEAGEVMSLKEARKRIDRLRKRYVRNAS
ncbi:MAG: type II toxin-antitoxin system ParD family antitoxin [Candidatus Angelobacter sp. Gp1-AA117]|nr:MAG: type II toxin-antitoxin system ParD family antitoxin [Candidatus Angelobacter sp. Gp1-AA117]